MVNITKTTKNLTFAILLALVIPNMAHADYGYGSSGYDYAGYGGWSDTGTGYYSGGYDTPYTSYDTSYDAYDYGNYSTPSYGGYSDYSDYGGYYPTNTGGSSYYPTSNNSYSYPTYNDNTSYPSYSYPTTNSNANANNSNSASNSNASNSTNVDSKNTNTNANTSSNTNNNANTSTNNVNTDIKNDVKNTNNNDVKSNSNSGATSTSTSNANANSNSNSSATGGNSNATGGNSTSNATGGNATGGNSNATGGTGGNANAQTGSSNAVNNNVNNIFVYTNPTGTAVVNNPAYQRLDGYCVITPNNPRVGQTVTATAYMTGGIGGYTYSWSGDLVSMSSGVSTQFTSQRAGTVNITVTARSGEDVATRNCTATFSNNNYSYDYPTSNPLSVACYPSVQNAGVNQTITWRAYASGGSGNYSYNWSGTDNLYGNGESIQKTYSYAGQKSATVNIHSNGQTVSATCNTNIAQSGYTGGYTGGYSGYDNLPTYGTSVSGVYVQPNYIKSGTPVSGVYLNDLPATGIDLTWIHYMVALMVVVLAAVATYVSKNKAQFSGIVSEEY
ncbi:MAG: hypothetical protein V4576_03400 [Patescibacteria group bacterium]